MAAIFGEIPAASPTMRGEARPDTRQLVGKNFMVTDPKRMKTAAPGDEFDAKSYWTNLIEGASDSDLDEVGHPDMGRAFNRYAYSIRKRAIVAAIQGSNQPPHPTIFEGAYGVGFYLRLWRELGFRRVAGVDISPRACASAKQRHPQYDLRAGDICEMQTWPDWKAMEKSFDMCTGIDVIYHIIENDRAARAVKNLGALVKVGGTLLVTDKFPVASDPIRETHHVVRRSLAWYAEAVGTSNFIIEKTIPMFWCMDPPVTYGSNLISASLAYGFWGLMRLATKPFPRNGLLQNIGGNVTGAMGVCVDATVLKVLSSTPNLTAAIFRRTA